VIKPDERSEDDYEQEVDECLEQLRGVLMERLLHRRLHHPGGALHLMVDNPTDRNFKNLCVIERRGVDLDRGPELSRGLGR
jgi:hypothetical protein